MGKVFRQIHIELSLFFLPLALLYAITGALYLSGFNQDSGAKVWEFSLPSSPKDQVVSRLNEVLKKNGLQTFDTELKKAKGGAWLVGSASYSATLSRSGEEWKAKVIQRGFWGNLIMLHKGKGKWYFDVLAYGFALSLMVFYFSGLMMTKFCNKRRSQALVVLGSGFLLCAVLGYLSLV